jgi:hypothetical protein
MFKSLIHLKHNYQLSHYCSWNTLDLLPSYPTIYYFLLFFILNSLQVALVEDKMHSVIYLPFPFSKEICAHIMTS